MALGKQLGEYSFKQTSNTVAATGSKLNFHGTATGFGTVQGTLTIKADAPGAPSGVCSWEAVGFLEDGKWVSGTGEGTWETVGQHGQHKLRVRMYHSTSNGQTFLSDGELELATLSFQGKLYEWS
jgi:hypothetical protein